MACSGLSTFDPTCQAGALADSAFDHIARAFANAAGNAIDWMWKQIDHATTINLSHPGINHDLIATGAIAGALCTALFVIQIITGALRHDPGALARGVRGLGVAFLGSAFAIATTKIVLTMVDQLSSGVVQFATGGDIDGLGTRFALAVSLSQLSNPAGLMLFSLVILAAVVIVWAAMMIRKMLVIVAAVMAPLAFAGGAADITRSWVRRWIELTAAMVASKLLLVVMLMIGLSVFEGAGLAPSGGPSDPSGAQAGSATQAGTQLATGTVLLLLAGLAPWIAIKMFHFAGDSLHAAHVQAGAASAGTHSVVSAPRKIGTTMQTGRTLGATSARSSTPSPSYAAAPVVAAKTADRGTAVVNSGDGDSSSGRTAFAPPSSGTRAAVATGDTSPVATANGVAPRTHARPVMTGATTDGGSNG